MQGFFWVLFEAQGIWGVLILAAIRSSLSLENRKYPPLGTSYSLGRLKNKLILLAGKSDALILDTHLSIGPLKPLLWGDKISPLYALVSPSMISCLEPSIYSLSLHLLALKLNFQGV